MNQYSDAAVIASAKQFLKFVTFVVAVSVFGFLWLSERDAPRFLLGAPGISVCDYEVSTGPDPCEIGWGSRKVQKVLWPWQSCEKLQSRRPPRSDGCCLRFK